VSGVRVTRVAERALLVTFEEPELERAVERTHALAGLLPPARPGEERTIGAGNLLIAWAPEASLEAGPLEDELRAAARDALAGAPPPPPAGERVVDVEYGGDGGPDLESVARECGRSADEVVRLHAGATYTVAFVGFAPGFPYLVGLPAALRVPRLPAPRPRVAAGAVAIAGEFAGIYPGGTPGGWRLLGRCELELFDVEARPPAALRPGDRLRFRPR
jgi:KipI family sensor histidine kinase inhibitor